MHVAMNWAVRVVAVLVGVCGAVLAGDHQYCVIVAMPDTNANNKRLTAKSLFFHKKQM